MEIVSFCRSIHPVDLSAGIPSPTDVLLIDRSVAPSSFMGLDHMELVYQNLSNAILFPLLRKSTQKPQGVHGNLSPAKWA